MAVTVRFINGTEREFPEGTAAQCDGPVFRVIKRNSKRRKMEDVAGGVFDSSTVTLAEVVTNGAVTERIVGRGRRSAD
jgi:hypothetical protein